MKNLTKTQNTIILDALVNYHENLQGRDNLIKPIVSELIDIYQEIT